MQNVNKFGIGKAFGDQQQQQQENNNRNITNLVTPPVRAEAGWSRRPFQITTTATSCQNDNDRPHTSSRRMSYLPSGDRAGAFRNLPDEDRDDAFGLGRRDGMIEWNPAHPGHPGHAVVRKDTVYTSLPTYRPESQRAIQRAPEQLTWHPMTEREWSHHLSGGVLLGARSIPREHVHSLAAPARWASSSEHVRTMWSRDGYPTVVSRESFPTVAQINNYNNYNQINRTRSGRGGSRAQHGHAAGGHRNGQGTPMTSSNAGSNNAPTGHRDVQAISMSSSNGSSTASGSCLSPPDASTSRTGEKRVSETLVSPTQAPSRPSVASKPDGTNKRLKPSPPVKPASMDRPSPSSSTKPAPVDRQSPSLTPAKFDLLDLLCTATLEMGPLQENPAGCSCPKSKCIALYCDCFKAGRRCTPGTCSCLSCKNTVDESGIDGARTIAIRTILARNPRAFTTAGVGNPPKELSPGQVACNCIRSRCLKLYCGCFQAGNACDPSVCTCISCLNTKDDSGGHRQSAIQQCLEKRPNAFQVKPREVGMGCACKNNRCVRKYCECFRTGLTCTQKCQCRNCENMNTDANAVAESKSQT